MNKKTFHLRWNNHLQNLQSLFENLYNEQSLVDVTISCSDGLLYGHKLVLSACSPYFEQVFKDNPCKHPIMILKGIKRHDMQVLLEYMYMGSVDVGEQDLEMLLETATDLQIKGLVQYPEGSPHPSHKSISADKTHYPTKDSRNIFNSKSPSPTHCDLMWQAELVAKPSTSKQHESNSLNQQLNNIRHNSTDEMVTSNNQSRSQLHEENEIEFEPVYPDIKAEEPIVLKEEYQEVSEDESNNYSAIESLEESTEKMQVNYGNFIENKTPDGDDVNFFCHLCTRGFQNKGSYHRHMLTHAGVKPHHCTFCNQSFLRLSHLQRHIRVHTGERPYSCGQCPKQFARSDKLRQHYIIQHSVAATSKVSKPRGRPRKVTEDPGEKLQRGRKPDDDPDTIRDILIKNKDKLVVGGELLRPSDKIWNSLKTEYQIKKSSKALYTCVSCNRWNLKHDLGILNTKRQQKQPTDENHTNEEYGYSDDRESEERKRDNDKAESYETNHTN